MPVDFVVALVAAVAAAVVAARDQVLLHLETKSAAAAVVPHEGVEAKLEYLFR